MPPQFVPAEDLLRSLGITEPDEIDVYAIAQTQGATVEEKPVTGCEARIMGYGEKALIVVNSESIPARRRFSAGHELGHWMRDAGTISLGCNPEAQLGSGESTPETRANNYASDLLLPTFMFKPRAENRPMTLETASDLAGVFRTSMTATAIRLVRYGSYPAMLVCSDVRGIVWSSRGTDVPTMFRPQAAGRMTFANALLRRDAVSKTSGQVYSDQWFSYVKRHSLHEESRRISADLVLTMLWWDNEDILIEIQEEQERRDYRRSDWRDDD
ncbi:MAG TPA: ImmA/IrrE family metallo-endopeptidase [Dehalococcoidia bacterium]|nr:ImmA/IrrE family metallo-endopeptidase [Dehalococcoidia bacterium]